MFLISDSLKVTYTEIGILPFIGDIGTPPRYLFFNWNKSSLYILRDGTYKYMKYILVQVGKYGMNLVEGKSKKSCLQS
jgi:hypothetical protein